MSDAKLEILITAKDEASRILSGVRDNLDTAFKVGLGGAAVAVAGFGAGLGIALNEAMEAEVVLGKLESVIESTGGVAGVTSEEAQDLADALMNVTRYSDDTILSAETMLLTFTNIGEDIFPRATEMTLNMAEMFGDADQAAIQLGKALNDPVQGVTALRRVGVSLSEEQALLIQQYMDQGDLLAAQTVIMDELEKEFGGVARAAGSTLAGKLAILKNKLLNVAEAVGMALIPVLSVGADTLMKHLVPAVERFGDIVTPIFKAAVLPVVGFINTLGMYGLERALRVLFMTFEDGSSYFQTLLTSFGIAKETSREVAAAIDKVMMAFFDLIFDVIVPFVQDHAEGFKAALIAIGALIGGAAVLGGVLQLTGALMALANPITAIIAAVALLAMAWSEDWLGIRTTLTQVWNDHLKPVIDELVGNLQDVLPVALELAKVAWETKLKPALQSMRNYVEFILLPKLENLGAWFVTAASEAFQTAKDAWENILKPALTEVFEFVRDSLLPKLSELSGWFLNALGNAFTMARQNWNEVLKPALEAIGTFVVETLLPKALQFSGWLTNTLGAAYTAARQAWNDVFKPALEAIGNFVNDTLLPRVQTFTGWLNNTLGAAFTAARTAWNDVLKPALQAITTFVNDTLLPAVRGFSDWFYSTLSAAFSNAQALWNNILKPALDVITNFFSTILLPGINVFANWFYGPLTTAFGAVSSAWNNILKPALDVIINFVGEMVDTILSKALEIGSALIEGIKDGITAAWDSFKDWLTDKANEIVDIFKDPLGIFSPSKAFAEIGDNIVKGLAVGLSKTGPLENALDKLAVPIQPGALLPAYQTPGTAAASLRDAMGGRATTNYFNLTVNTNGDYMTAQSDFNLLRAWAS